MNVLVMNCNTSSSMTADIVAAAEAVADPGTVIVGAEPAWGPESAEGFYESFLSAAAVLDTLRSWPDPFDAVVMAGFGEHGREGARQLLSVPVVDITEAAVELALLVGHRFGIVTTVPTAVAPIHDSLLTAGLASRCSGVVAARQRVLDTGADVAETARILTDPARALIEAGADVIVLGCAGYGGLDRLLERVLGVPVIDGVAAAVKLAESLVQLGKTTSKAGAYAPPMTDKSVVFPTALERN